MFLLFAVVIGLIGHTTAVAGLILALKNRRRRSHYKEKEAVEFMLLGAVITVLAALLPLSLL
mgnify:CR=1 FL=1